MMKKAVLNTLRRINLTFLFIMTISLNISLHLGLLQNPRTIRKAIF